MLPTASGTEISRQILLAEDSDSSAEITPRKRIPRKSSERKRPVAAALLDGSGTSASETEPEQETPSPAATPKKILQRDPTVTLDDEFEVDQILEGPRKKDGKFRVSWVGFPRSQCTWEPRRNLPDSCFPITGDSDESGDERPIHLQMRVITNPRSRKKKPTGVTPTPTPTPPVPEIDIESTPPDFIPPPVVQMVTASVQDPPPNIIPPTRVSRISHVVATRTTFESNRSGLRQRTGQSAGTQNIRKRNPPKKVVTQQQRVDERGSARQLEAQQREETRLVQEEAENVRAQKVADAATKLRISRRRK